MDITNEKGADIMYKIITMEREFGSGGRELGRRLADVLGFDYYDREIITAIAQAQGMDEGYVEKALAMLCRPGERGLVEDIL